MLFEDRVNSFENHLDTLLSKIEELWLGSWKYVVLGELANCENFEEVYTDLLGKLNSEPELDVNEHHLKILLGGSKHVCKKGTSISALTSKKGCYIANIGYCTELPKGMLLKEANVSQQQTTAIEKALDLLKVGHLTKRDPIILVLDYDIQVIQQFPTFYSLLAIFLTFYSIYIHSNESDYISLPFRIFILAYLY